MRLFLPFFFLMLFPFYLQAQSCHSAAWVKSLGGNGNYQGIVDGDRLADGRFVVMGTFGNAPLLLDTIQLAPAASYNVFLALHDSAGNILQARVIAWGNGGYITPTALDAGLDGRIHICGYYDGNPFFIDSLPLIQSSGEHMFAASFDLNLQFRWKRESERIAGDVRAYDVSGGLDGGVYLTGYFEGNALRFGSDAIENAGGWNMWRDDAYLVKFDSLGQVSWMKSLGTPQDEAGMTVTADSLGNVILTGSSNGSTATFKFDDQTGVPGSANDYGIFLAKYEGSSGKCLWGKVAGGLTSYSRIYANDACRGEDGSIYITGQASGTVAIPPHSFGGFDGDGFLAKISTQGELEWLKKIGGQNSNEYGIDCSYHKGNVAVTGKLFSNQPYAGDFPLHISPGGSSFDIYNAMFDENGAVRWARAYNSPSGSDLYASCVLIDDDGNQLFWGSFRGTQQFYPHTLSHSGSNPKLFLARFIASAPQTFSLSAGLDKNTTCNAYVTLDGSISPASADFAWYPDLGFLANNDLTPNVVPKQPSQYILYGYYQGCIKTDTVFVDITNYNNLAANAGQDTLLCRGSTLNLNGSGGSASATYSWWPPVYLSTTNAASPQANPPYPTDYILTVTEGNCEAKDTVHIGIKDLPYIFLPKQDLYYSYYRIHLCQGDPLDIDLGDPANTYLASPASLLSAASNNLITLNAQTPGGILVVQASDSLGCTSRDSANIIIHNNLSAPLISGSVPNRTACEGDSLQIPVYITHSSLFSFQYGWYAGWQLDKGDGNGWQDISPYDFDINVFNYSYGYPSSSYYTVLRIYNVKSEMDGYRIRFWIQDYCSPRTYSNIGEIHIGPKITQHPQDISLCYGVTDSISVQSSSLNANYHWEVFQNGSWDSLVPQAGWLVPNGRFLRIENASMAADSVLVRCRMSGCSPQAWAWTDSALIRVIPPPSILWQSMDDSVCEGSVDSFMVITNDGPYTYQWYENNNPLTYNTSQRCCFNTNKLKFTPVYLTQNNYYYKLRIRYQACGYDTFSIPVRFFVSPTTPASWAGSTLSFCEDDPAMLLSGGSPAGGTYSGPGVSGNLFDPAAAGPGTHTLWYGYTGPSSNCSDSVSRTFVVHPTPLVSWGGGGSASCSSDSPLQLSGGIPAGGLYSGPGVSGTLFHPANAGVGQHTLIYQYTNAGGCSDTAQRIFSVWPQPLISWQGDTALCLNSGSFLLSGALPSGGSYYGAAVTAGQFDPLIAGLGYDTVWYKYTDPSGHCTDSSLARIYVDPCVGIPAEGLEGITVWKEGQYLVVRQAVALPGGLRLSLLNGLGQELTRPMQCTSDPECRLLLPLLPPGFYLLRMESEKGIALRKLIF